MIDKKDMGKVILHLATEGFEMSKMQSKNYDLEPEDRAYAIESVEFFECLLRLEREKQAKEGKKVSIIEEGKNTHH